MIKIGRHASVTIVSSEDKNRFLLSRYDDGYPVKIMFRGWGNLTGGANSKKDSIYSSPEDLVRRELSEEYSIADAEYEKDMIHLTDKDSIGMVERKKPFAPKEHINVIKESILNGLIPYADYLVNIPGELFVQGKNKEQYRNIFSVFLSELPSELFELAGGDLEKGLTLVNEGSIHLANLEELKKGFPLLAWATAPILMDYTGANLPNLINATAERVGSPRKSFEDYFNDFQYESEFFKEQAN
jgi:hypothetical protein